MAGIVADVRGGLGGQVACLLGQCAQAWDAGDELSAVHLNVGEPVAPFGRVSWLDWLFERVPRVETVKTKHKLDLEDVSIWAAVARWRGAFAERLGLVDAGPRAGDMQVIHVRSGDRQPASIEALASLAAAAASAVVIGNELSAVQRVADISGHGAVNGDPRSMPGAGAVDDWLLARRAGRVLGAPSYFTLTAAILEPGLEVHWLRDGGGPAPMRAETIRSLEAAMAALGNVRWL
ncbi:MAG TPA: hypothetical protein VGB88_06210 [Alphaproteobacteria bacterium]